DGFAFIVQIYSGDDRSQLVIGRWMDHLVVMNGDDYKNRLKLPRISARIPKGHQQNGVRVLIRSGPDGSVIELQDHAVVRRPEVVLEIPSTPRPAQIVLGNSIDGRRFWAGQIRRFEIRQSGEESDPLVVFDLSNAAGAGAPNSGSAGGTLGIPAGAVAERRFLEWPIDHQFSLNQSFVSDTVINLFGFVPFGMAVTGILSMRGVGPRRSLLWVLIWSASLSLFVEYVQTWMPTRSSSALDLMLNILGGLVGLVAWAVVFRPAWATAEMDRQASTRSPH
ncbi:MAG: VanZ family protein, partial [Verrucomicrobiales bacterium]